MSDGKPIVDSFREDIDAVIRRYRSGHCLSYAEAIGTIYMILADLVTDASADDDDADDGEG